MNSTDACSSGHSGERRSKSGAGRIAPKATPGWNSRGHGVIVIAFGGVQGMAKHTNKIWRTVVFSGAMLMTPLVACGGGGGKKADTGPPIKQEVADPGDKPASDEAAARQQKEAADKEAADKAAEEQRLMAEKEAADKKAADELAAKEEADKKAADEAAAKKKARPRTTKKERPTGRGFILS
jgi:hypothetical protein